MRKAQAEVVGFVLLTLIVIAIVSISFFWAKPQIDKINNVAEVKRIENRMLALNNAIRDVANEKSQRTVPFDIKKGQLYLANDRTITYSAYMDLPDQLVSSERVLAGNKNESGPCMDSTLFGTLGTDEAGCLIEKGSIELELKYINLNDTANNECHGIFLTPGDNAMVGSGSHTVLLTFKETNTSAIGSCTTSYRQIITVDMN